MKRKTALLIQFCLGVFLFYGCFKRNNLTEPSKGDDKTIITITGKVCYFADSITKKDSLLVKSYEVELPSAKQLEEIHQVTDYIGLPLNFRLFQGNVPNALATIVDGQRIIIYQKDLLDRIDRQDESDDYWKSMFIIAHEVGHHLSNHFSNIETLNYVTEIEADRFAAATLYRLGATLQQVRSIMSIGFLSSLSDSKVHPSNEVRAKEIEKAYNLAAEQLIYHSAIPPPISNDLSYDLKTEFKPEDFQDSTMLEFSKRYDPDGPTVEGIIIKATIDSEEPDIESRTVPSSLLIHMTDGGGGTETGKRFNFLTPSPYNILAPPMWVDFQNLPVILRRGNKIRFKYYFYNHYYNIYYIKYLPR